MKLFILTFIALAVFMGCVNSPKSDMKGKAVPVKNNDTYRTSKYFDTTSLAKTAEMLDENKYWDIMNKSLKNIGGRASQEKYVETELEKLTPKEMIGFSLRTSNLVGNIYTNEMWCAAYIMNGGCSDDGFEYFRLWLVSLGKDVYYKAKADPDYLINEVIGGPEEREFEGLGYVPLTAFKKVTGKNMMDYIDWEAFKKLMGSTPEIVFTWNEDKPETMQKICPKLFAKFWNE